MKNEKIKICLASSSGGHFEQLKMLKELEKLYNVFFVTEKTDYTSTADYYLIQTGLKDPLFILKMFGNLYKSVKIWSQERPDYIVTTGTMVVLPLLILAKIFGKKIIYIETFARIHGGTRTGRLMHKYADVFIVQWKTLKKVYPNSHYGGSIY